LLINKNPKQQIGAIAQFKRIKIDAFNSDQQAKKNSRIPIKILF